VSISFACPSCRTPITLGNEYAGQKARCKACGHKLIVPTAAPPSDRPLDVLPVVQPPPRPRTVPGANENPFADLDSSGPGPDIARPGYRQDGSVTTIRTVTYIIAIIVLLCCSIPLALLRGFSSGQRAKQQNK
jgi:DNA-directed RNA polymerase subunit RPC12/RpoP